MKATLLRSLTAMLFLVVSFGLAQYNPKLTKEEIAQLEELRKATAIAQVYHTNGNLWITYDTNGDIAPGCNATVPAYTYPGGSIQYYLCRGGVWVTAKSVQTPLVDANGATVPYLAAESGYYTNTGIFEGVVTVNGWADPNNPYSKEPWVTEIVYQTATGVTVTARRYSWSYPGKNGGRFFKVGEAGSGDYDDFVVSDYRLTYTGDLNGDGTTESFAAPQIDQLAIGIKADHDCSWNVGPAGFEENFWEDDLTEYDAVEGISYERDGDNPTTAEDDTGIDDPKREFRGSHVGHVFLYAEDASGSNNFQLWDGTQYSTVPATKDNVSHYWWTGANDPTTPLKRYLFSTAVFNASDEVSSDDFVYDPAHQGDLKEPSEWPAAPTDMRYGMGIGPFTIQLGQTVRVIVAEVAGFTLSGIRNAAKAARDAMVRTNRFANFGNLPAPSPAPAVSVSVTPQSQVRIEWNNTPEGKTDPLTGTVDFAGYKIYRAAQVDLQVTDNLFTAEGVTPDAYALEALKNVSKAFRADAAGPYQLIRTIGLAELAQYQVGPGQYEYIDPDVVFGFDYWYYVAAYDTSDFESARTMNYPTQDPGTGTAIPVAPLTIRVYPSASLQSQFASQGITVVPNPWTSDSPKGEIIFFVGLPAKSTIRVFDVSGAVIWDKKHDNTEDGTEQWDLFSNALQRVVSGVYFVRVENDETGDAKFAKFVILRK